jgi:hypothetical protein
LNTNRFFLENLAAYVKRQDQPQSLMAAGALAAGICWSYKKGTCARVVTLRFGVKAHPTEQSVLGWRSASGWRPLEARTA